jgi:hypothetical protein
MFVHPGMLSCIGTNRKQAARKQLESRAWNKNQEIQEKHKKQLSGGAWKKNQETLKTNKDRFCKLFS